MHSDPIVFSREWFTRHQSKLLWLLNHWLTRRWFRWVLCIRKHDIGYRKHIVELRPDAYTVWLRDDQFASDFRAHHKYGKRLYHAFLPVWLPLHFWDWLVADRCVPQLSFGFATLTAYPDASTGATTVDGTATRNVDETFPTIHSGAGVSIAATGSSGAVAALTASAITNQFNLLVRGLFSFNTSISGAPLSAATLSLFASSSKNTGLGSPDLHAAGATLSNNNSLTASDFQAVSFTSFGSIASASWTTSVYNDITFNGTGIAAINASGISQVSVQLSWDLLNSFTGVWSSGLSSIFNTNFADQSGNANDPKLVITYTGPNTINQGSHPRLIGSLLRPRSFAPGRAK